jgi:hypothetical protein
MDASQYKDYILTLLFMKYVSDKYAGKAGGVIEVPEGGSFADMVKLKGDKEIGDKMCFLTVGSLTPSKNAACLRPTARGSSSLVFLLSGAATTVGRIAGAPLLSDLVLCRSEQLIEEQRGKPFQ